MQVITGNYEVIKSINTSLVLDALRINDELSRSDLSRITGLTTGTITNITAKLLDLELIKEVGSSLQSSGGRRPVLLRLNDDGAYALAIDIRTTSIEIRLVDLKAKIIYSLKKEGTFSLDQGTKLIIDTIQSLIKKEDIKNKLVGIGISIPGWVDYETGKIIKLPNLVGWENYPIKQELENNFGIPVYIENDANLSALAELWFGKGKKYNNMVYVLVEDGIGTGLIINQQIYRGSGISIGELGHIPITNSKKQCSCGNIGCLDTVASAKAMIDQYLGITNQEIDYITLIDRINHQDKDAFKVFKNAEESLGFAVSILVNILHPEAIIFGGKVIHDVPSFLPLVKEAMIGKALSPMLQDTVIFSSDLKDSNSILGAVALVFQTTLQPYSLNSI